jgi:5-methylcytosine-specific restriction protein A
MPQRPPTHKPPGSLSREQAERRRKAALDAQRPSREARGYDSDWRRVRDAFAKANPTCCVEGCNSATQEIDHLLSIKTHPHLRLAWGNLRAMCRHHHSARTARDQGFARGGR